MKRHLLPLWLLLLVPALTGAVCDPSLPPKPCRSSAQCLADHQCDPEKKLCIKATSCSDDTQCNFPLTQCTEGICRFNGFCQTTENCQNGQECVDKRCTIVREKQDKARLYLKFDDTGTSKPREVHDSSTGAHHGTWTSTDAWDANGYLNRAALFKPDATNHIVIKRHEDFQLQQMTVEAWVYLNALPATGRNATVLRFCDQNCRNGYALWLDTKGFPNFSVASSSLSNQCRGKNPLPLKRWVHIAGSYDGRTIRCFLNGAIDGSVDEKFKVGYENSPDIHIGSEETQQHTLNGLLDEVAITATGLQKGFSPGLTKYLYVADEAGKNILAIDTEDDKAAPSQSFSLGDNAPAFPVALSPNGKFIYLWNKETAKLYVYDLAARKRLLEIALNQANIFSPTPDRTGWWAWGNPITTLSWDLKSPKELRDADFGDSVATDVAFVPGRNLAAVTSPEDKRVLFFDLKTNTLQKALTLPGKATTAGEKPLAVAVSPNAAELYVSFTDAYELRLYQDKSGKFSPVGSYKIFETTSEQRLERRIAHMLQHPRFPYLYYVFEKPGFIYRFDTVKKDQLHIWTAPLGDTKIQPFTSLYRMHMHHLGTKFYVQRENSGVFYAIDITSDSLTESNKITKEINLSSKTFDAKLPIVGVNHPNYPY